MSLERRRLSQQMQRDLRDLTFSTSMREAVLARVREEEAGPQLRAVPPLAADAAGPHRNRPRFWQRTGAWLGGGAVAAAAIVLGIALAGPGQSDVPPQMVAGALPQAEADTFALSVDHTEPYEAELEADTSGEMMMTIALDDGQGHGDGQVDDADSLALSADEPVAMAAGTDDPDADAFGAAATGNNGNDAGGNSRPSAGVAARPGSGDTSRNTAGSRGSSDADRSSGSDRSQPASAATLTDLNKEAEMVVLAQVKDVDGDRLKLAAVQALKGKLPKGDLVITLPSDRSGLKAKELVVVFLRESGQAEEVATASRDKQSEKDKDKDKGKNKKAPPSPQWKLVGGMAGIFRLSADGHQAESQAGAFDLDALKALLR